MTGRPGMLTGIEMLSGVSAMTGEGFLTIRCTGENGDVLVGQQTPAEARQLALDFLAAAEGADMDSMVMAELVDTVGLDEGSAAGFLVALRKRRGD